MVNIKSLGHAMVELGGYDPHSPPYGSKTTFLFEVLKIMHIDMMI